MGLPSTDYSVFSNQAYILVISNQAYILVISIQVYILVISNQAYILVISNQAYISGQTSTSELPGRPVNSEQYHCSISSIVFKTNKKLRTCSHKLFLTTGDVMTNRLGEEKKHEKNKKRANNAGCQSQEGHDAVSGVAAAFSTTAINGV